MSNVITKTLLTSGTLTILPAAFVAEGGGYSAQVSLDLKGFYTAAANQAAFVAGGSFIDSSVPTIEIVHRYRFSGGYASYYANVPYNNIGASPDTQQQAASMGVSVTVVSNTPPVNITGTLTVTYFTKSNSVAVAGSSYYQQDFLYKIWSPVY